MKNTKKRNKLPRALIKVNCQITIPVFDVLAASCKICCSLADHVISDPIIECFQASKQRLTITESNASCKLVYLTIPSK
jgi:hypothetical protein